MKTRTIRSTLVLTSVLAANPLIAAQPDSPETDSSSEPAGQGQLVQGAVLAVPSVGDGGGENQMFFRTGDAAQQAMREMREKLNDPEARAALQAEHRAALAQMHEDIEAELGIDANTKSKVMDLLADDQLTQLESSFLMQGDFESSMQKQADSETRKLQSLRALLGQDGLEKFQFYLSTIVEREAVKRLNALLPASDKLQPEQKTKLVQLLLENNERTREQEFQSHMARASIAPMAEIASQEALQRRSQLLTIEANEASLRRAKHDHPLLEKRAAAFLSPLQLKTLQGMHEQHASELRAWIERARLQAGLSPDLSDTTEHTLVAQPAPRAPLAGDATFEFTVTVNGRDPITHTHTGPNAQPILFEAKDGLWIEATPTLYVDHWLNVHLAYYEQVDGRKRRIDKDSSVGTLTRLPDGASNRSVMSTDVISGSRGYAVKTQIQVLAP